MTDKQYDRKPNGDLAKKPGWFSWRHQTNEAHLLATAGRSRHERRERKRHEAGTEELQPGAAHVNTRGHALRRAHASR